MDYNFKLQFEINLQSFATIAVAVNLWDHSDIKKKVKDHFSSLEGEEDSFYERIVFTPKEKKWNRILKKVTEHANLLELPEEILNNIKSILEPIGDKVFYWNLYLLQSLHLDPQLKFGDKLYLNQFGIVDENKIFQMHWEKMDGFKDPSEHHVILLSCIFAQEDFIRKNLACMIKETELYLSPVQIVNSRCNSYAIIVIWFCIHFTRGTKEAIEVYKKIKKSKLVASQLFYQCKTKGLLNATKYFWNKLTEAEKQYFNNEGVGRGTLQFMNSNCYEEEKSLEIVMFLINNLPEKERFEYISEGIVQILQFFMNVWPFQKLVEPCIDKVIDHIQKNQLDFLYLYPLNTLSGDYKSRRFINREVCRQILYKVSHKISKDIKITGLLSADDFMEKLFNLFDMPVLSFILNDKDLQDQKEKLLNLGNPKFKKLIKSNKLGLLDRFMKDVIPSKKDQKKFKLKLNIANDLKKQGKTDLAEQLIKWISDCDEEQEVTEQNADSLKVWPNFKNLNLD